MVTIGHFRRRGWYDVDALQVFNRGEKGGMYWFRHGFNVPAMTVWSLSAVAGLLFSANTWFVGPGATALGGIDIGFLVAGAVAAVLYPLSLRLFPEPREVFGPSSAADPVARPVVPTQPPVPPTTAGEAELV
jgi:purine-cytosine permease-like protein